MGKKVLLVMMLLFNLGFHTLSSQVLAVSGPSEVTQFSSALYTVILYNHRGSGAYYPDHDFGTQCFDFRGKKLGEHQYEYVDTFFFHQPGTYTMYNGFVINVKPNPDPMRLEIPLHICPYGTQLITNEIPSYFQKRFTILDNSSIAEISNTGVLTYDPTTTKTIKVLYEIFFRYRECKHILKDISLYPHSNDLTGTYRLNVNGRIEVVGLSIGSNPVNKGQPVEICFQNQNLSNFSWEILSGTGISNISYNQYSKIFRFTPTSQAGSGFRFRFYYNEDPNCTHLNECDYGFTIRSPYTVSYVSPSNMITVKREDNSAVSNRILPQVDTYRIVDALTGIHQKQGQLVQNISEIDVSNISNGIYMVQISFGGNTESYKISINR